MPTTKVTQFSCGAASISKAVHAVPDLNVRLVCPDCKIDPPNLVEEFASGDIVCGTCGLIVDDKVVATRPECKLQEQTEG
jgi:transcription initiation factor TFIIB